MKIVIFAAPGIIGPFVFASLLHLKENVVRLVLPKSQHSISSDELLAIAAQASVPHTTPDTLHDPAFVQLLKDDEPDLIIVATYDRRIPREIIDIPLLGAVNIHPSLLPKYRGPCPEFWAVRNGEIETGVTIHYLDDAFDTGDILMQEKMPIAHEDTLGMVLYRFASTATRMVVGFIDGVNKGSIPKAQAQNDAVATDAPLAKAEDLRIVWQDSAESIYNLIRAANPVGGAWTTFRGFQLKVWHAVLSEVPEPLKAKEPGSICLAPESQSLFVRTSDAAIELKAVQQALYYILDGWSFCMKAFVKEDEQFV